VPARLADGGGDAAEGGGVSEPDLNLYWDGSGYRVGGPDGPHWTPDLRGLSVSSSSVLTAETQSRLIRDGSKYVTRIAAEGRALRAYGVEADGDGPEELVAERVHEWSEWGLRSGRLTWEPLPAGDNEKLDRLLRQSTAEQLFPKSRDAAGEGGVERPTESGSRACAQGRAHGHGRAERRFVEDFYRRYGEVRRSWDDYVRKTGGGEIRGWVRGGFRTRSRVVSVRVAWRVLRGLRGAAWEAAAWPMMEEDAKRLEDGTRRYVYASRSR
jgi:hypothetical protein